MGAIVSHSMAMARGTTTSGANTIAPQPSEGRKMMKKYPPRAYSTPCAKLTTRPKPNTRLRPRLVNARNDP